MTGRGGEIRTRDPHNPIVVRYQAALRPDRLGRNDNCQRQTWKGEESAAQNLENLFKFRPYLLDNLLALSDV